jgi:hypothetical protein
MPRGTAIFPRRFALSKNRRLSHAETAKKSRDLQWRGICYPENIVY